VRLRFAAGAASHREVAQAEAFLSQARAAVPPIRMALEAQLNRLDVLLGAQPGPYGAKLAIPTELPNGKAKEQWGKSPPMLR
jgi:outer membrane protein TolC